MKRQFYIISYDIGEPKRLNRVRKFLVDYGEGVQKSVFECWLTESEIEKVINGLMQLIDPKEDRVRIYKLCRECIKKVEFSGIDDAFTEEPPDEVII